MANLHCGACDASTRQERICLVNSLVDARSPRPFLGLDHLLTPLLTPDPGGRGFNLVYIPHYKTSYVGSAPLLFVQEFGLFSWRGWLG